MKSLFIRCSEETYNLAHALAKEESRSLNKQIIHMIHKEAKDKEVSAEVNEVSETKKDNSKLGLYSFEPGPSQLHKYREGVLRFPLRTNIPDVPDLNNLDDNGMPLSNIYEFDKSRMTGTYLTIKLYSNHEEKFNIFAIGSKLRKSFN